MQIFLVVVVLVLLALLSTNRRFYRLRRSRVATALLTGGWLAVAAGFLLGEFGLGVISPESLRQTTPLLIVGLGWIGMMVGLQLRSSVLAAVPRAVKRLTLVDLGLSAVVLGVIGGAGLWAWASRVGASSGATVDGEVVALGSLAAQLFPAAMLLIAGGVGWSMETRSQRVTGKTEMGDRLALIVRLGGALGAVAAIAVFGLADKLVVRVDAAAQFDALFAVQAAVLTVLLAVFSALLGRFALELAGADRGQQLAVFLALVTFVAGVAAQTDLSPLFAAMLTGIVLTNLPNTRLERFERFILQAEHAVAVFFALLAGLLLNPMLHPAAVALAVVIASFRWLGKPAIARLALRAERRSTPPELPPKSSLYTSAVRQSPVAMAMAVALVADEWSAFHRQMLAVVLLIGLLSELFPLLASLGRSGRASASSGVAAQSERERSAASADAEPATHAESPHKHGETTP